MNFKRLFNTGVSRKIIFNCLMLLLLVYFSFHSVYGGRGIIAYFQLNQKLAKSYDELESLRGEMMELEHKTSLLRLESLDKDMLDERARSVLGLASPNEQVFTVKEVK